MRVNAKAVVGVVTVGVVLTLDILTKRWALVALADGRRRHILNELVPLTLAFNEGAAFSLHVGPASRWFFPVLSIVALGVVAALYRSARPDDYARLLALALVGAGALGNLLDRLRWDGGVVDFIGPIDLGFMHWPIFNVADMAITCGAALLLVSLWREERQARRAAARPGDSPPARR